MASIHCSKSTPWGTRKDHCSYIIQYPLAERMMKPASNPKHYEDLVKELEEAPKRSWLAAKLNRWKGFLRLS